MRTIAARCAAMLIALLWSSASGVQTSCEYAIAFDGEEPEDCECPGAEEPGSTYGRQVFQVCGKIGYCPPVNAADIIDITPINAPPENYWHGSVIYTPSVLEHPGTFDVEVKIPTPHCVEPNSSCATGHVFTSTTVKVAVKGYKRVGSTDCEPFEPMLMSHAWKDPGQSIDQCVNCYGISDSIRVGGTYVPSQSDRCKARVKGSIVADVPYLIHLEAAASGYKHATATVHNKVHIDSYVLNAEVTLDTNTGLTGFVSVMGVPIPLVELWDEEGVSREDTAIYSFNEGSWTCNDRGYEYPVIKAGNRYVRADVSISDGSGARASATSNNRVVTTEVMFQWTGGGGC